MSALLVTGGLLQITKRRAFRYSVSGGRVTSSKSVRLHICVRSEKKTRMKLHKHTCFLMIFYEKKVLTVSVTVTRGCLEGVFVTVTGRVTGLLKKRNHSTPRAKHAQQENTPNQRLDQTPLQTPLEACPATGQNTPTLNRVFHRVIHGPRETFSAGLRRGRIHPGRPVVSVRLVLCKFLGSVVVHVVSFPGASVSV